MTQDRIYRDGVLLPSDEPKPSSKKGAGIQPAPRAPTEVQTMTNLSTLSPRALYERGIYTLEEVESMEGVSDWSREHRAECDRRNNIEHLRQLRACRAQDHYRAAYIEGPMWGYVEDFPKHLRGAVIEDDATDIADGGRGKFTHMSLEYHGLMALLALANGDITWTDLADDDDERAAAKVDRERIEGMVEHDDAAKADYAGARIEGVEPPEECDHAVDGPCPHYS